MAAYKWPSACSVQFGQWRMEIIQHLFWSFFCHFLWHPTIHIYHCFLLKNIWMTKENFIFILLKNWHHHHHHCSMLDIGCEGVRKESAENIPVEFRNKTGPKRNELVEEGQTEIGHRIGICPLLWSKRK